MDLPDLSLRPAYPADKPALSALINSEHYVHRHLDWRPPLDWLGYGPYWLLFARDRLLSALACPPDPPGIAWIRLFAVASSISPSRAWRRLFDRCLNELQTQPDMVIAALSLQRWFTDLLTQTGFQHHQNIVVLNWGNELPSRRPLQPDFTLRPMQADDIPAVSAVDQAAFEPLWRNSVEAVALSFDLAAYATVVEHQGQIVAFQISTSTPLSTHLARLAVLPGLQRQNLAYNLVYDLFSYFRSNGSWQLTVNTQSSNSASLALYQALGFQLTGDSYPVYTYPL